MHTTDKTLEVCNQRNKKQMESCLLKLPLELWIKILAQLDEQDLNNLNIGIPRIFENLINDNELWKQIFLQLYETIFFTNLSKSNNYYDEFILKMRYLKEWKHNRGIKTKYTISTHANRDGLVDQIEHLVFEYPKVATYNNGIITILNLENNLQKKKQARMTYIPCTTPQGCSTMNFNLHAANFGRYDGRVFGKNLSNKSYLSPVIEYDSIHSNSVSSINSFNDTNKNDDLFCCSGDLNGLLIWWCNSKKIGSHKLSTNKITHIFLFKKNTTVVIDQSNILYLLKPSVEDQIFENLYTIELPIPPQIDISLIKLDYGSNNLILCSQNNLYIVSIKKEDFGDLRSFTFRENENIQDLGIDESTSLQRQDPDLIGYDGCYISILTDLENDTNVYVFNVRSPLRVIKPQIFLPFQEKCFITAINDVVLLVAFDSKIGVFNPLNGQELRVIKQVKEKYPQFLKMSDGKIIIGSNDTFQFIQYVKDLSKYNSHKQDGKRNKKPSNKSFKSVNALNTQLDDFFSQKREQEEQREYQQKLIDKYGGSIEPSNYHRSSSFSSSASSLLQFDGNLEDDEEDIQMKIAMMESQDSHLERQREMEEAEMIRLAIEASTQQQQQQQREEPLPLGNSLSSSLSSSSPFLPVNTSHEEEVDDQFIELTEDEALALAMEMSLNDT